MVEEGYEFFAKRQLVTIFSAPNYCGEFENAGAMMSVDETLMCSFQVCGAACCCACVTVLLGVLCADCSCKLLLLCCTFQQPSATHTRVIPACLVLQILKPAEKKQKAIYGGGY